MSDHEGTNVRCRLPDATRPCGDGPTKVIIIINAPSAASHLNGGGLPSPLRIIPLGHLNSPSVLSVQSFYGIKYQLAAFLDSVIGLM